jgi:hypothetical protein
MLVPPGKPALQAMVLAPVECSEVPGITYRIFRTFGIDGFF